MEPGRVHIVGASGSGTTTLGRALADAWSVPHADVDDYFWEPSDPPYTTKRDRQSRLELMEAMFVPRPAWVLSGSLSDWGDALIPMFDAVVYLTLDPATRLDRLNLREGKRYGSRIEPGGDRADAHAEFVAWAASYDDASFDGRSAAAQERWLAELACPVLRMTSGRPVVDLVATVLDWVPGKYDY